MRERKTKVTLQFFQARSTEAPTPHYHTISHNRQSYQQDAEGITVETAEYLRELHNLMILDMPLPLNTHDPAHTCPHCRTAYRDSDQRDHDRCPFCWRMI